MHPHHVLKPFSNTVATARFLRAVAPGMHKRRGGRLPRQQQPDAIRLEYYKAIMRHLHPVLDRFRGVRPDILHLLIEQQRERGDHMDVHEPSRGKRAFELLDKAARNIALQLDPRRLMHDAERFGKRTSDFNRQQLGKQVEQAMGVPFSAVEKPIRDLIPLFAKSNVELIKTVPDRYHDRIAKEVRAAFESGMHPETLAKRWIEIDDMAENDARRIARDQIGKLNAQFNEHRQSAMGVTGYIWRTARDQRVRDGHRHREGKHFEWDDPPEDGHPGEPIQCRCNAEPDFKAILEDL